MIGAQAGWFDGGGSGNDLDLNGGNPEFTNLPENSTLPFFRQNY